MSDETIPLTELLAESSINLTASATGRDDAIRQAGAALLATGAIEPAYIDAMLERENSVSTFVGEGVAIPHGTLAGKDAVKGDALVLLRFPDGVDWDGNDVSVAIGIAAKGNGHIALLSQLATILLEPEKAAALRSATTKEQVYELLAAEDEED
ncbi:PTS sugar transporter subunit IIA [Glaciihabitans arcticus]|uniref:Mannitol-specific phosphotransferase enzyme IIA component n=1 Tax=Glaciihabitans arcticus TaxID=2668039 RepID=A0A4Q9GPR5_9MICO|nr:PTS sugar transporter subunit IIA [Glaciihabitans arcticus]TBN56711.1 PTS sugar transporter subunit IIA [Glaciihabitans arcticus]